MCFRFLLLIQVVCVDARKSFHHKSVFNFWRHSTEHVTHISFVGCIRYFFLKSSVEKAILSSLGGLVIANLSHISIIPNQRIEGTEIGAHWYSSRRFWPRLARISIVDPKTNGLTCSFLAERLEKFFRT